MTSAASTVWHGRVDRDASEGSSMSWAVARAPALLHCVLRATFAQRKTAAWLQRVRQGRYPLTKGNPLRTHDINAEPPFAASAGRAFASP